jgi:hypothetical protein
MGGIADQRPGAAVVVAGGGVAADEQAVGLEVLERGV